MISMGDLTTKEQSMIQYYVGVYCKKVERSDL